MLYFIITLGLCCSVKESYQSFIGRPLLNGPSEALLHRVVVLRCELLVYPQNETILLQLFKVGDRSRLLGEFSSLSGEAAEIPMVAKQHHDGNLECVATAQNNSAIMPNVSNTHNLRVIEPVESAKVHVLSGPTEFHEGESLKLYCSIMAGSHVSYKWLLNGQLLSTSSLLDRADHLVINRTTRENSGSYACVATNQLGQSRVYTSNSSGVVITVKELVSDVKISFTVLKEATQNYSAVVNCQASRGTPPITFTLFKKDQLISNDTTDDMNATFRIPLVLDTHLGWFCCQADNGGQVVSSGLLPIEVVAARGPVEIVYDSGENHTAIRFYCKAANGSQLRYQWFLNNTRLPERGRFYYVVHNLSEGSVLLWSVRSVGTYHCEVSDIFDNSTAISSRKVYIREKVLNRIPAPLVVVVVFGSFIIMVSVIPICCWVGVMLRRKRGVKRRVKQPNTEEYKEERRGKGLRGKVEGLDNDSREKRFRREWGPELDKTGAAYEDELDTAEYSEDAALAAAARTDEFDEKYEADDDDDDDWKTRHQQQHKHRG